jgi:hypothetical protein
MRGTKSSFTILAFRGLRLAIGVAAFMFAATAPRAHAYGLSNDDGILGAYAAYGVGLPTSYGGGVILAKVFSFGYAITNRSSVLNFGATARDHDRAVSPILGFNVSYVSTKEGDIHVHGYDRNFIGTMYTMNLGVGVRLIPGFYLDGGVSFFKGQAFSPFVRMSWPLY